VCVSLDVCMCWEVVGGRWEIGGVAVWQWVAAGGVVWQWVGGVGGVADSIPSK
jgi:hypothetical protein